MTSDIKFCIFCGKTPERKNKEHVLPQWLIKMTGDPKRTVNFGMDPRTKKIPRFDWSSFTFPACTDCNESYSTLEQNVKELVQKLLDREPINALGYVLILDWLDKVRIGLWLGYSYLHKNPTETPHRFHINSRVGQKDRMLAVYTINSDKFGLNTYGAETLCFQTKPSCFSLRINNIVLLNMSWDLMCAARCGFPFPKKALINLDMDNMLECSNFSINHKVKHPIYRRSLIKPSIHIYQPIIQSPMSRHDYKNDVLLSEMLISGENNKGVIYRQLDDRVTIINDMHNLIENGDVKGWHCRPLKDIIAQTYELQFESLLTDKYESSDKEKLTFLKQYYAFLRRESANYAKAFKNT